MNTVVATNQSENPMKLMPPIGRVAVVGVGAVGSTIAFSLASNRVCKEIILVDDFNYHRTEGELLDIQHSLPFIGPIDVSLQKIADLKDCDCIIITSGAAQKGNETRLDLMKRNIEIYQSFFPALSTNNPNAIFCIVSNPVDIMTRVALELSGLPPERVFGTGTILDTARFRQNLSNLLRVSNSNIHAYVVGEHGDSEVLLWSRCMVGPYTVAEYAKMKDIPFNQSVMDKIDHDVRRAAYQIIERKGSTHFAIGIGTAKIVEIISQNRHQIYTVSRQIAHPGLPGKICMSLPTELCRGGAINQLGIELLPGERESLLQSAEILQKAFDSLTLL